LITDVPSSDEFREVGLHFLNDAWGVAVSHAVEQEALSAYLDEGRADGDEAGAEETAPNPRVRRSMATALATVQQGVDFLLKARIAEVSPFLLIDHDPARWPRQCDKTDTPFSAFRTLDAQDLVRAHDTVAAARLPEEFKALFDRLRQHRNTSFHTVDRNTLVPEREVILAVLKVCGFLLGNHRWPGIRLDHLADQPADPWSKYDLSLVQLNRELTCVVDLLGPADVKKHLGFDPKQRRYCCPNCFQECRDFDDGDTIARLAQLHPNTAESTSVKCLACGKSYPVVRKACGHKGCKGNVIEAEDEVCLTCYAG
jgi:hypothetical protein